MSHLAHASDSLSSFSWCPKLSLSMCSSEQPSVAMNPMDTSSPIPRLPSAPHVFPILAVRNGKSPALRTSTFKSLTTSPSPPSRSRSPTLADTHNGDLSHENPFVLNDVDPQIIEALKSKDRLYVLKLGEIMESLIIERRLVHLSLL